MNSNPKVSIIIRTLNEAPYLPDLFKMIRQQSYSNYETIVVDSNSYDGTREMATQLSDKVLEIEKDDFTFGFAINYGIQHSDGDLACIISAHTKPLHQDWLKELVSAFGNDIKGSIAMSYGKQVGDQNSNFSEIMDFESYFGSIELEQSRPDYFCNNANSMIRKDLWRDHPFDESLTGLEDIEWSKHWMDKGYKVIYKPEASIVHFHNENGQQIRNWFWRESIAARSIGVLSVWKILNECPRQFRLMVRDIIFFLRRKSKGSIKDIISYRGNRLIGTIKSITNKKFNLKDYRENYHSLAYKVIEYEKQNKPVEKVYSLDPIKPNDVLIKVAYVGICETDFEVLRGALDYYKSGWAKFPIVPGHEYSGVVARVGSKVTNLKVGDKVVGQCILSCNKCDMCLSGRETACSERKEVGVLNYNGAYSEYIILASRFAHKIPKDLQLDTASSIEPLAVVLKGLDRVGLDNQILSDKESVLVIGAGPIGHLSARVTQHWGHDVTVIDSNQGRLDLLQDIAIETKTTENNYTPYSHIIECTGTSKMANTILKRSAPASSMLLLGLPYDTQAVDLENIVSLDKRIVGTVGSNRKNFEDAIQMAPSLNLETFNKAIFEFEQWESAWDSHRSKNDLKVKIKIGD